MKNHITTFLSTLFALLFFISCTQEETILSDTTQETMEPVQLTEQEIITSSFNLNGLNDSTGIKKDNMKVLWDKHKTITLDGKDWHEFGIEELVKPDLEEGEITDITYSLLATLTNEKPAYWLVKMNSHNGESQQSYFELENKAFTGMTYLFDMEGTISMSQYLRKGQRQYGVKGFGNESSIPSSVSSRCDAKINSKGCTTTSGCPPPQTGGCQNGGGGKYQWGIVGTQNTDWYLDRNGDGRGQANEYTNTTTRTIRGWVWVPSGGSAPPSQNSWYYNALDGNGNHRGISRPSTTPDRSNFSPPSCESFKFSKVGGTNWQCASVIGVHDIFSVFNWDCIGVELAIFHQPLHFQLPINSNYALDTGGTKIEAAYLLHSAFKTFEKWYRSNNPCNKSSAALEQKLLDYIKDEFEDEGGRVNINPPSGFTGTPTAYKKSWPSYGNCN